MQFKKNHLILKILALSTLIAGFTLISACSHSSGDSSENSGELIPPADSDSDSKPDTDQYPKLIPPKPAKHVLDYTVQSSYYRMSPVTLSPNKVDSDIPTHYKIELSDVVLENVHDFQFNEKTGEISWDGVNSLNSFEMTVIAEYADQGTAQDTLYINITQQPFHYDVQASYAPGSDLMLKPVLSYGTEVNYFTYSITPKNDDDANEAQFSEFGLKFDEATGVISGAVNTIGQVKLTVTQNAYYCDNAGKCEVKYFAYDMIKIIVTTEKIEWDQIRDVNNDFNIIYHLSDLVNIKGIAKRPTGVDSVGIKTCSATSSLPGGGLPSGLFFAYKYEFDPAYEKYTQHVEIVGRPEITVAPIPVTVTCTLDSKTQKDTFNFHIVA